MMMMTMGMTRSMYGIGWRLGEWTEALGGFLFLEMMERVGIDLTFSILHSDFFQDIDL